MYKMGSRLTWRRWTREEDEHLIYLYPTHSVQVIADILERTFSSVQNRVRTLGLKKGHRGQVIPDVRPDLDHHRIVDMYHSGITVTDIAKAMGCSNHAVALRLKREGITVGRTPKGGSVKGIDWDTEFRDNPYENDAQMARRLGVRTLNVKRQRIHRGIPSRYTRRNTSMIVPFSLESVRRQVYKRDNYSCQRCGCDVSGPRKKCLHHIVHQEHWTAIHSMEYSVHDPKNLITLCRGCHRFVHRHFRALVDIGYEVDVMTFKLAMVA